MEQNEVNPVNKLNRSNSRVWTGLFLVAVGVLLFANKMGVDLPPWLFTWPMLLIGIGLLKGVQSGFRDNSWIILLLVGSLFLWDNIVEDVDLHDFIVPIIVISIGVLFIFRPKKNWQRSKDSKHFGREGWKNSWGGAAGSYPDADDGEYLEINSVFSGANKRILSKNFKGGEINCFMGGAEIDLTQADIQGTVIIESNVVFGGLKITIPPHWDIKTEVTTVFGGIEDQRPVVATKIDLNKVIVLKGNTIFGGIEIRSY